MKLPKGVNPKYGIFTTNREFADKIIDQCAKVNVLKRVKSKDENCAIMKNGTQFKWIKPNDNARGNKCSAGIIDLATCSFDFVREWIPSIRIFAEKSDYIFKGSEFGLETKPYDLHTVIDRLKKQKYYLVMLKVLDFMIWNMGGRR